MCGILNWSHSTTVLPNLLQEICSTATLLVDSPTMMDYLAHAVIGNALVVIVVELCHVMRVEMCGILNWSHSTTVLPNLLQEICSTATLLVDSPTIVDYLVRDACRSVQSF
jgi:hypothetical protein